MTSIAFILHDVKIDCDNQQQMSEFVLVAKDDWMTLGNFKYVHANLLPILRRLFPSMTIAGVVQHVILPELSKIVAK